MKWRLQQQYIIVEAEIISYISIETVFVDGSRQQNIPSWEQLIGHSMLIEYKLGFAVNFSNGESECVAYTLLNVFLPLLPTYRSATLALTHNMQF